MTDNLHERAQRTGLANLLAQVAREGRVDLFAGKRERQRYSTARRFELRCQIEGEPVVLAVVLRNLSGAGLAVWSHHEIPAETRMVVRAFNAADEEPWLVARVTHCTAGVGGYLVGANFDYPVEDPPTTFDSEADADWTALEAPPQRRGGLLARLFAQR